MNWVSSAYAQAEAAPAGAPGVFGAMMPILLMFLVFYFLLIRPQQKRVREHQAMLDSLERGDEVVTNGGVYGTIVGLTDTVATLKIASVGGGKDDREVRIKVDRSAIARKVGSSTADKDA